MIDVAEIKIVVKENTHEFLTGSFGDYRQTAKDEVHSAAHEIAYHELCNDWMNNEIGGEEVSKLAQEIADELSSECPVH